MPRARPPVSPAAGPVFPRRPPASTEAVVQTDWQLGGHKLKPPSRAPPVAPGRSSGGALLNVTTQTDPWDPWRRYPSPAAERPLPLERAASAWEPPSARAAPVDGWGHARAEPARELSDAEAPEASAPHAPDRGLPTVPVLGQPDEAGGRQPAPEPGLHRAPQGAPEQRQAPAPAPALIPVRVLVLRTHRPLPEGLRVLYWAPLSGGNFHHQRYCRGLATATRVEALDIEVQLRPCASCAAPGAVE